ncbi:nucleoside triphosphate hydrolase [Rhizobium sp. LC145]|uniref:nucleoside triphosphate hydrolase n=1 Tax=Rhizobium sp. LC145 TaxID=1120688 RepID=UPI00062A27A0|nr:nucleoside triphosphate hydrolase [Rhizobium sp. LC145]KKX30760.1 nucleoside triphosphate hydrolase [Rhizobium sp. LC145]TKT68468.1 nucleoside triphosphate hydrolase [Rhizobiaceae bacterium LC148]
MNRRLDDIADDLIGRAGDARRFLIAVAGPPGAGKSTFADKLVQALRGKGEQAEVLPMDGFHMDDAVLKEKGLLSRKGAPETFDIRGLTDILTAVRQAEEEVLVPVFERSRELAVAAARIISPKHRFIVVEGNYLLLKEERWAGLAGLFDYSIMLTPPHDVLEQRLVDRWRHFGLSEDAVETKVAGNDLPNGHLILAGSRTADLTLAGVE